MTRTYRNWEEKYKTERDEARAELIRFRDVLEKAEELIQHLQRDRGHTECRIQTSGAGSYQCGFRIAYESAKVLAPFKEERMA